MPLSVGARLGVYEVVSALGAGGMGEVYRARDTRLKRDVAIKVLLESLARDTDRVARFQREAELLATLNHPNIAAIYGIEQTDDATAIVMELVDGESLADRIARGPLPLDEALALARQIADGLEAAHERGVIHRDLKPANIKVAGDGRVKLLDFGLAKALDEASNAAVGVAPPGLTASPTLTAQGTRAGVILGTAAYMSPEQARGKGVDRRADIWAYGCVLYEMLTARAAFAGESLTDVLSSITRDDPDWTALPGDTPQSVRTLLRRCLQKDPQKRLPHVGVARIEIDDAAAAQPSAKAPVKTSRSTRLLSWAAVSVVALIVSGMMLWSLRRAPVAMSPLRASIDLGAGNDVGVVIGGGTAAGSSIVVSPDGIVLAFVGQRANSPRQLYVRRVNELQAVALGSTSDASNPFFSPDGRWIGFFADGKLKKVAVTGGAAVTICSAPNNRGGTWLDDGSIVLAPTNVDALFRVPSTGGEPQRFTELAAEERTARFPDALPGGKGVLYTSHTSPAGFEEASIVVATPSGARKTIVRGGYYGRYLASGHVAYVHEDSLFAAPFDVNRLELIGPAVPLLEALTTNSVNGGAQWSASAAGSLAYLAGANAFTDRPIHWLSSDGSTALLRATPAPWANPVFSPDGRRLALQIGPPLLRGETISVLDPARDRLAPLSPGGFPVWTPDGQRIAFAWSDETGVPQPNIYWQRADGSGERERLTTGREGQFPYSWHPSGRFLAFTSVGDAKTGANAMALPIEGSENEGWKPGTPIPLAQTAAAEQTPAFSPDGHWIAYSSNETGRQEIWVRPFPSLSGKWMVSTSGGSFPVWSRTKLELFFSTLEGVGNQQIMVVSYRVHEEAFESDTPRPWTNRRYVPASGPLGQSRRFDLHPDGQRMAVALAPETTDAINKVVLVTGFFDELRRVAPAR